MNENKNESGGGKGCLIAIVVVVVLILIGSCSSSDKPSKYETDMRNGVEKTYNGEKMTKDEYDAANDYFESVFDDDEKTYSDWNN